MHSYRALVSLLIVMVTVIAGGCGGQKNPAMSLQFANRVFVVVDPEALPKDADGNPGPGNAASLHLYFVHEETTFDAALTAPAIVIYSNVRYVPAGTAYTPARVLTLYGAAMADSVASGIVVNPNINGAKNYAMTKAQIKSAIPRVMQNKPLPFEVHVAGRD